MLAFLVHKDNKDTTANITIGRTLRKLCKFGFLEALREMKVCPSTYFNVWFLCMALQEVFAKCSQSVSKVLAKWYLGHFAKRPIEMLAVVSCQSQQSFLLEGPTRTLVGSAGRGYCKGERLRRSVLFYLQDSSGRVVLTVQ